MAFIWERPANPGVALLLQVQRAHAATLPSRLKVTLIYFFITYANEFSNAQISCDCDTHRSTTWPLVVEDLAAWSGALSLFEVFEHRQLSISGALQPKRLKMIRAMANMRWKIGRAR